MTCGVTRELGAPIRMCSLVVPREAPTAIRRCRSIPVQERLHRVSQVMPIVLVYIQAEVAVSLFALISLRRRDTGGTGEESSL